MESTVISRFFVFLYFRGQVWHYYHSTPMYTHKVPNRAVDMDSRALLACYPRGNFWLMIFPDSITKGRFTKFWFPICSTYPSRS